MMKERERERSYVLVLLSFVNEILNPQYWDHEIFLAWLVVSANVLMRHVVLFPGYYEEEEGELPPIVFAKEA